MTKFRDLLIGDSFDWIGPKIGYNSYYKRCKKISPRQYESDDGVVHRVGSINAEVYHVNESVSAD